MMETEGWRRLSVPDQAEFVLGFHHQTRWHRMSARQRDAWIMSHPDIDLDSPKCFLVHKLKDETLPDIIPDLDTADTDS